MTLPGTSNVWTDSDDATGYLTPGAPDSFSFTAQADGGTSALRPARWWTTRNRRVGSRHDPPADRRPDHSAVTLPAATATAPVLTAYATLITLHVRNTGSTTRSPRSATGANCGRHGARPVDRRDCPLPIGRRWEMQIRRRLRGEIDVELTSTSGTTAACGASDGHARKRCRPERDGAALSDATPQPWRRIRRRVDGGVAGDHVHALPTIPAVSSATPQPIGTATAGVSTDAARADHVHAPIHRSVGAAPVDTGFAGLAAGNGTASITSGVATIWTSAPDLGRSRLYGHRARRTCPRSRWIARATVTTAPTGGQQDAGVGCVNAASPPTAARARVARRPRTLLTRSASSASSPGQLGKRYARTSVAT